MLSIKTSQITTSLIYIGTALVSILSFFTTWQGLQIFLDGPLALIGSLGLQMAMLGIAWNLIRFKEHRIVYAMVFLSAALFSVFFSYTNFNMRLKEHTRADAVRAEYTRAARPMMRELSTLAKEAAGQSQYQLQRVNDLLEMEEQYGWATVVDEGSNDPLIQEVIDGARRTVESWNQHQGTDYRQGSGKGIITNYLTSWRDQVRSNNDKLRDYVYVVDSLSGYLTSDRPVAEQHALVNYAAVRFPVPEYKSTLGGDAIVPEAPLAASFVEKPTTGQQALRLVIEDLWPMDRLTMFAIAFAVVIDLIVLAMALCGSFAASELDLIFAKVERDTARRIKRASMNNPRAFSQSLRENIERLREAAAYGRDLSDVLRDFQTTRSRISMTRGPEDLVSVERRPEFDRKPEQLPMPPAEEKKVESVPEKREPLFVSNRMIQSAGKYTGAGK